MTNCRNNDKINHNISKVKIIMKKAGNFKLNFQSIFLLLSMLSIGLFHEFLSCIASAALCVYLLIMVRKNGSIKFMLNTASISIVLISLFYGITIFWAIDSGMAVIGFLKFLPLPLFMLAAMQSAEEPERLLDILPPAAAFMTVVSAVLSVVPVLKGIFLPAERLAGFLQYSNTYALLALLALIISVTKKRIRIADYFYIPILFFGIILSGSRAVFALTVISIIILIAFGKNKKAKIFLLIFSILAITISGIYAAVTNNFESIGRFLTISIGESTFLGRLLYWYDALPIILKNPFGTGYQGYFYLQSSIQSGVYVVRYIHNDFLQLMLDVGWLPTAVFIVAILRSFFKRNTGLKKRLLLFVMSAHCFFDFDLQFIAVFMIFVLLLDFRIGKEFTLKPISCAALSVIFGCLSAYMCISLTAAFLKNYNFSRTLYPWNTNVNTAILSSNTDAETMNRDADLILAQNKYVTAAYSAKANAAFSKGDFAAVMEYKDSAIKNSPLDYEEYEDYIYKLLVGIELYTQADDLYSADFLRSKLNIVLNNFYSMEDRLSYLGRRIDDQPISELPPEIMNLIEEAEK